MSKFNKPELLSALDQALVELDTSRVWIHNRTGLQYEVLGVVLNEGTGIPMVRYRYGAIEWVYPVQNFLKEFIPEEIAGDW